MSNRLWISRLPLLLNFFPASLTHFLPTTFLIHPVPLKPTKSYPTPEPNSTANNVSKPGNFLPSFLPLYSTPLPSTKPLCVVQDFAPPLPFTTFGSCHRNCISLSSFLLLLFLYPSFRSTIRAAQPFLMRSWEKPLRSSSAQPPGLLFYSYLVYFSLQKKKPSIMFTFFLPSALSKRSMHRLRWFTAGLVVGNATRCNR